MRLRFAAGIPRAPAPRRGAAMLGVFAILLQAALFAWHNHAPAISAPAAPGVSAAAPAAGPEAPGRAHADCQICFALGHHSAAPVGFAAAPPTAPAAMPPTALAVVVAPGAPYPL